MMRSSAVVLLLACSSAVQAQEKISLEPREKWTNLGADAQIDLHFTVKAPKDFKGRIAWNFRDAGSNALLGANEIEAAADVKISLKTPALNPGVVRQARLTVTILAGDKPAATYEKIVWIFAADPFADRAKWLATLKITLFETDAKGPTAEALKKLKVPFEESRNVAALDDLKDGVLLVGEGVSLKEEAGLAEAMVRAASRGVPVLCLAPRDGALPLPGADNDLPAPGSLTLARAGIIAKLDKRLDAAAWAPDNQVVIRSLAIKSEEGKTIGDIQDGAKGWPWLQIDYPGTQGRLVLCGFPIIGRMDAGPTPRYLLARLFEHVTERSAHEPRK